MTHTIDSVRKAMLAEAYKAKCAGLPVNTQRLKQIARTVEIVTLATEPESTLCEQIDKAAAECDPNPSDAAKEAGNYRKGHVTVQGLPITIENARGSTRRGKSKDGKAWSVVLKDHYGYVKRTESEADGDHIDVFIGPNPESEVVFVVDQTNARGGFDEHKCMVGWNSGDAAKKAYFDNYSKGWTGFSDICPMTMDQFKNWIAKGDTGKPLCGQKITATLASEPESGPAKIRTIGRSGSEPILDKSAPAPVAEPPANKPDPADDLAHATFAAYLDALIRAEEATDPEEKEKAHQEADRLYAMMHGESEHDMQTLATDPMTGMPAGGAGPGSPKPQKKDQGWEAYHGPYGGRGIHNPATGERIYGVDLERYGRGQPKKPADPYKDWMVPGEQLTPELRDTIHRHMKRAGLPIPGAGSEPAAQHPAPQADPMFAGAKPSPYAPEPPSTQFDPEDEPIDLHPVGKTPATLLPDPTPKDPETESRLGRVHQHFTNTHQGKSDEELGQELGRIVQHYPAGHANAIGSRYGIGATDTHASIGQKIRAGVTAPKPATPTAASPASPKPAAPSPAKDTDLSDLIAKVGKQAKIPSDTLAKMHPDAVRDLAHKLGVGPAPAAAPTEAKPIYANAPVTPTPGSPAGHESTSNLDEFGRSKATYSTAYDATGRPKDESTAPERQGMSGYPDWAKPGEPGFVTGDALKAHDRATASPETEKALADLLGPEKYKQFKQSQPQPAAPATPAAPNPEHEKTRAAMKAFLRDRGYASGKDVPESAKAAMTRNWNKWKDHYLSKSNPPADAKHVLPPTASIAKPPEGFAPAPKPAEKPGIFSPEMAPTSEGGHDLGEAVKGKAFMYEGVDANGQKVQGRVVADSPDAAVQKAKALGHNIKGVYQSGIANSPNFAEEKAEKRNYGPGHHRMRKEAESAGLNPDDVQATADQIADHQNRHATERNEMMKRAREIAASDPRRYANLSIRGKDKLVGGKEDDHKGMDEIAGILAKQYPGQFQPETAATGGHHTDQLVAMLQEGDLPVLTGEQAYRKALDKHEEEAYHKRMLAETQDEKEDEDFIPFSTSEEDPALIAFLDTMPEGVGIVYTLSNDGWERYDGPRGGKGWRHVTTGRVVYTAKDNAPGYRRRQIVSSSQKAGELGGHLAGFLRGEALEAPSEAHLRELADHVQALPIGQLRSLKNQIMGTWGNVRRRQQMVQALTSHVRGLVGQSMTRQADENDDPVYMPSTNRRTSRDDGPGLFDDFDDDVIAEPENEPAQQVEPASPPEASPAATPETPQAEAKPVTDWKSIVHQYRHGGEASPEETKTLRDSYAGLDDKSKTHFAEQFGVENAARALPDVRDEMVDRKIRELDFKHGQAQKGLRDAPDLHEGKLFDVEKKGVGESGGLFDEVKEKEGSIPYTEPEHNPHHVEIGKRFGIPPEAVKDLLETHPDQLAKRDRYLPPSSGRDEAVGPTTDYEKHPLGSAKIDSNRHGNGDTDEAYVGYLRDFDPHTLKMSEHEDGMKNSGSVQAYTDWARQGHKPPPIDVFDSANGNGDLVSTNRRRVLAAQAAAAGPITGWHGPVNRDTGNPLKYGDVKRAFAELSDPKTSERSPDPAVSPRSETPALSERKTPEQVAAEALAKNENISETMRRNGMDPLKDRKAVASAMEAARANGKPSPSDERKKAQERALANQAAEPPLPLFHPDGRETEHPHTPAKPSYQPVPEDVSDDEYDRMAADKRKSVDEGLRQMAEYEAMTPEQKATAKAKRKAERKAAKSPDVKPAEPKAEEKPVAATADATDQGPELKGWQHDAFVSLSQAMDKQLENENNVRKKFSVAAGLIHGESPAVAKALAKHMADLHPEVWEYAVANPSRIPMGIGEYFKA